MIWSVDGIDWDIPCQIDRTAEVRASDISGMLLDKSYFNDVLGTYMQYDISIAVPLTQMDKYTNIYEILTNPVDAHVFVLPYNQSTITITGRITVVNDGYVYKDGINNYWRRTKFSILSNHPSKEETLSAVISRGLTPLPPYVEIPDGALYEWDAETGTWSRVTLINADERYY